MSKLQFIIYQEGNQWRWRIKRKGDNAPIHLSFLYGPYTSVEACECAIADFKKMVQEAGVEPDE